MGGCGSKARVLKEKEEHEQNTAPEEAVVGHNNEAISESDQPQPQAEARPHQLSLHEILDLDLDPQSNKRPSLSYLFHQSEDAKAKNVKEEASDCEVKGPNEGMKQESQVIEAKHQLSEETQSSNKAEKCEGNDSEQQAETRTSAESSEDFKPEESEGAFKAQIGP